jgi:predicted nuclease of predicted toxin-antitoxin system
MRFYADENFPLDTVIELRRLGHDVLTIFEDGRANKAIADEAVLRRATKLDRVLLTINRLDFKRLHNADQSHAGIVICTFDPDFVNQATRIDEVCRDAESIKGTLVRTYRKG